MFTSRVFSVERGPPDRPMMSAAHPGWLVKRPALQRLFDLNVERSTSNVRRSRSGPLAPFCGHSFLVLSFFLALLAASSLPAATSVDVLIVAASDAELKPLLDQLESPRTESRAAWRFWLGTLRGRTVALTRSEGDPLNAVASTTLAIRRYAPKLVVTLGSARAHDPALQPGDLVVSEKFAAFDGFVSPHRDLGAGSDSLTWHKLRHPLMTQGEQETRVDSFPADAVALAAVRKLKPNRGRLIAGTIGSANQVNREADRIAYLREQWGTSTEDGESAHVAGCAQLLGVPAIGWRILEGRDGEAAALVPAFLEAWK